ncbi:MAG: MGMT family protein [Acidobacteriia bacterium]|nr:MGMT family protein [Terriglobia bacterium]
MAIKLRQNSFFENVYLIVRDIPFGQVVTYGQIADLLGNPRMARQVGWAMNNCPSELAWYRVVGTRGRILTHSFGCEKGDCTQRYLLEQEGVSFIGSMVDIKKHQISL